MKNRKINNSTGNMKRQLDCLFIYPPLSYGKKPKFALPQLGLLYLAGYLKNNNIKAEIIDAEGEGLQIDEIIRIIKSNCPLLVGIYTMTPHLPIVLKLADSIKKEIKNIKLVIGGPHVSSTMAELMEKHDNIDFLVYGEGEKVILDLFKAIKNDTGYEQVKNLIYRGGQGDGEIKVNPREIYIEDLNDLPFPDIRLIQNYQKINYKVPYMNCSLVISMMATRGCPYRCTFCDQHITHGRVARIRSVENIIAEIKFNIEIFNAECFIFKDSTFTLDQDWAKELCRKLIKEKIKIKWVCNTRVDKLDEELLILMKKAGCEQISFGVESGNQQILNNLKKGTTIPMIRKTLALCKKAGIKIHASFMIGSLGETRETVEETIKFAISLDPDYVTFDVTTLYPGTEIYDQSVEAGLIRDPKWYLKQKFHEGIESYIVSPLNKGKIDFGFDTGALVKQALRRFYFRPKYIAKMLKRIIKEPHYLKQILNSLPALINWVFRKKQTS